MTIATLTITPRDREAGFDVTDDAAALFTWDNGQTMRAVEVTDFDGDVRVRCIPRTRTGRDHKGHYGHWLALDSLPDEFADALRAALAPTPAADPAAALDALFEQGRPYGALHERLRGDAARAREERR